MPQKKTIFIISVIALLLALVLVVTYVFGKPFRSIEVDLEGIEEHGKTDDIDDIDNIDEVDNPKEKDNTDEKDHADEETDFTDSGENEKSKTGKTMGVISSADLKSTFDTPEEAVEYFVQAISQNDLEDAFKACSIEEYSSGFDFFKLSKRLQAFTPKDLAPSQYIMYEEMNAYIIASRLVSQIKTFTYSLLTDMDLTQIKIIENDDEILEFIEEVNPEKLKNLKLVRVDMPYPNLLKSEKAVKNLKAQAETYGANEATEMAAFYELDGQTYLGGFYLIRYNSGWKIVSINSAFLGTSVDGSAIKMTMDEYLELLE